MNRREAIAVTSAAILGLAVATRDRLYFSLRPGVLYVYDADRDQWMKLESYSQLALQDLVFQLRSGRALQEVPHHRVGQSLL